MLKLCLNGLPTPITIEKFVMNTITEINLTETQFSKL